MKQWLLDIDKNNRKKVVASEMKYIRKIQKVTRIDTLRNSEITNHLRQKPIQIIVGVG